MLLFTLHLCYALPMEILPLLDELRIIAGNGLTYATNPYDRERYERLLMLTSQEYGRLLDLPTAHVAEHLRSELGHITPKVGADAAIFDEEGRVLLHQRADNRRWCLPCGWVDPNESPEEAAVREVREETGLSAEVLELVGVYFRPAHKDWGLFGMVAVVYLCRAIGGELTLSHEGLALRYRHLGEPIDWHGHHESYARLAHERWCQRE